MPSSAPALQSFDYDEVGHHFIHLLPVLTLLEPSSPDSSEHPLEDDIQAQVLPVGSSPAISRPSDAPPVTSTQEALAQENIDAMESPQGRSILKRWLQKMGNKSLPSHKPDRRSGKSRDPADHRSPSRSPPRVDDRHERPSRMAAARPTPVSPLP